MAAANYPSPPSLNFAKTQRIVLLIDLHPILTLQNPTPYITAVNSAASRLLRFPPLSASLSAFRFFFSSLTPLRSAAVFPTTSLSFNLPSQTLDSLSIALNSISTIVNKVDSLSRPSASHIASSLLQLIHDYAWETENDDSFGKDDLVAGDFEKKIPSNLVCLFSPAVSSINCLSACEFDEVFSVVREGFASRDIHLCWIDVVNSDDLRIEEPDEKKSRCGVVLKDGIEKMGWGFCSSDLIVLGSALLPLGLIYPKIGVSLDIVDFGVFDKRKCHGALSLEILDVNGMPLECKCCDLEVVSLKSLPSCIRSNDLFNDLESSILQSKEHGQDVLLGQFGSKGMKLHVKQVHRYDECVNNGDATEIAFVRECFEGSAKNRKTTGGDFFADKVLEMLHEEMGGVPYRGHLPTWQILLSFLHLKGYWALVSIASSNGNTLVGSLKPFTSHLAILSVFSAGHVSIKAESGSKLSKIDNQSHNTCAEVMNDSNSCFGSQTETSTSGTCAPNRDVKKKKNQRYLYQEMTWGSFCKAASGGSTFDLFEAYNATQFGKSKKIKFLKCWMRQIIKDCPNGSSTLNGSKSMEKLVTCNGPASEPSQREDGSMAASNAETSETFFSNLSKIIQHGLKSGMDLPNLAERVVKSSIYWLRQKCETENIFEDQEPRRNLDDSCSEVVVGKLIKLLLRKPKEMKKLSQDDTLFAKESTSHTSSETIVREYELQIFLRMEILQSDVSAVIEETRKQKLLKQICSLLEIIQYLVAGGFHGDISLYDYVEQSIKARYSDRLGDVVTQIYSDLELDLLPYGEGETPSFQFNSEDSNPSWKDRHERYEKMEYSKFDISVSTDSQPPASSNDCPQETAGIDEHAHILNEAKERRERNRRFVSFTSRAPDLQRVWAPKQSKVMKGKSDSHSKKPKNKDRQRPSYSVVCETPMMGNKRSCSRGDKEQHDVGNPSYSVSKALFQDT